jgi:RNA polymerase sigma factor (sigma-70 family)
MSTYISLAKKTIAKFSPQFYNSLSKEMLSSEDAVSDVATAIMYADWRFDENRKGKNGQNKTLYSYRNQCAIWAIKTYITQKYKSSHKNHYSLDQVFNSNNESNSYSLIANKVVQDPLDIIIDKESKEEISNNIKMLLNNSRISEKQKQQIQMYYFEGQTLSKIGKHFNISREAVRQSINRALDIIKSYDTVNN